jgi:hypothetical protein
MNPRRVSLILLVINLTLVAVLAWAVYSMKGGPAVITGPAKTQVVTNTVTQIAVRKINATNLLAALAAGRSMNWRALESTNYVTYIDNLLAFGCPDETVQDIIIADIAKLYAQRRAALRAQLQPYKFWQTVDPVNGTPTSPELQQSLRALDKEQRELVHALLGVDLRKEMAIYTGEDDYSADDYSFLPAGKQESVRGVADKYDELEQEIFSRSRGLMLDEDQEAIKQLQRERRAELATVLTPEELDEYDLRHSETANNMRTQLAGFQPSEDEFRRVFRLQKTFDDNFEQAFDARDDVATEVKARAQQDAQAALNAEVQKILGPERFAEYQRAQDMDYRALLQLGERFELPAEVANRVYSMKLAAEQYKLQVETNPNITEAQREQMIAALARETERSVTATLGDQAVRTYQKTGGQWLGNIGVIDESAVPPPPQPPGTRLPYDINLLPPELRAFLLNPPVFPQQPK